mmetsp:Transcript_37512/g.104290  ORF Transcript_37512/g.104290 Transcript_37512/m.104290 type:complete len:318 (-) Transcript_37512:508-1461(-)
MPDVLEHAPDLAVLPFLQGEFDGGYLVRLVLLHHLEVLQGQQRPRLVGQFQAVPESLHLHAAGQAVVDLHLVALGVLIAWVDHDCLPLVIVSEEQETCSVAIDAPHGYEPTLLGKGHEVHDSLAALRVLEGGDHALRLVQHDPDDLAERLQLLSLPVEEHLVLLGVNLCTYVLHDFAVDLNTTLQHEFCDLAPRASPSVRQELVEPDLPGADGGQVLGEPRGAEVVLHDLLPAEARTLVLCAELASAVVQLLHAVHDHTLGEPAALGTAPAGVPDPLLRVGRVLTQLGVLLAPRCGLPERLLPLGLLFKLLTFALGA